MIENNVNIIDLRKTTIKELVKYDIEMQLYNEFNDEYCKINEYLGEIYTKKDIEETKKREKERRKELIKEHINEIKELLKE